MTISKKILKREIEATKILIEGLKEKKKDYLQKKVIKEVNQHY